MKHNGRPSGIVRLYEVYIGNMLVPARCRPLGLTCALPPDALAYSEMDPILWQNVPRAVGSEYRCLGFVEQKLTTLAPSWRAP